MGNWQCTHRPSIECVNTPTGRVGTSMVCRQVNDPQPTSELKANDTTVYISSTYDKMMNRIMVHNEMNKNIDNRLQGSGELDTEYIYVQR